MTGRTRARLVLAIGAVLSYPAVRTWMDGDLAADTATIRVALAVVVAAVGVAVVGAVINAYTPEPTPEDDVEAALPAGDVEDAVLVEEQLPPRPTGE